MFGHGKGLSLAPSSGVTVTEGWLSLGSLFALAYPPSLALCPFWGGCGWPGTLWLIPFLLSLAWVSLCFLRPRADQCRGSVWGPGSAALAQLLVCSLALGTMQS